MNRHSREIMTEDARNGDLGERSGTALGSWLFPNKMGDEPSAEVPLQRKSYQIHLISDILWVRHF